MAKQDPWFFEERAAAFARLVLTEHKDVKVQPSADPDRLLTFLSSALKDGKTTLRFFGVRLVPYLDLPTSQNAGERVLSHLASDPSRASLPICVFVIGVRKPEGIYRWIVEPVVEDRQALLRRDGQTDWQTLDEAGVARLIGQVNAWYDAPTEDPLRKRGAGTRRRDPDERAEKEPSGGAEGPGGRGSGRRARVGFQEPFFARVQSRAGKKDTLRRFTKRGVRS